MGAAAPRGTGGRCSHWPRPTADPDRLDVTRDASEHLAFGRGIHASIGASIARPEGAIAIGTLLSRFPGMKLACDPDDLRWRPSPVFRGLDALPVTVRGGSPAGGAGRSPG